MLITQREDINPLLGMAWLRSINWTIGKIESATITDQSEKDKKFTNFWKLFKTNRTKKKPRTKYN